MESYLLDMDRYKRLARQAAAESCVLLRNEKQTLPLKKGEKVAVYGRMAFHYYKSGLGSGGLVNTYDMVGILDALRDCKDLILDQELLQIYEDWIAGHPYEEGEGWGKVPWSQKEMPLTEKMLKAAQNADVSLIFIGRTAGEDQDNRSEEGSYFLTRLEKEMIQKVCSVSDRVAVILNVGNIIDMSWVETFHPQAVLYVWQGGQEGGNGTLDVLMGRINACGKLADTIAWNIEDYPSTKNFGDIRKNFYEEDIYVGYRYFETFAKEKVLYPFGFGLSYTVFSVKGEMQSKTDTSFMIQAVVKNIGDCAGKEVLQLYVETPQGKLGNPVRRLVGFAKTKILYPKEEEMVTFTVAKREFASYDDSGVTGNKSCYVLEEGEYRFYLGTDVRTAACIASDFMEFEVIERLEEAYAPIEAFLRIKPSKKEETGRDEFAVHMEEVPRGTRISQMERKEEDFSLEVSYGEIDYGEGNHSYTGDKGYQLIDVLDGKVSMDDFLAQIEDKELIYMLRGEGMCSPKVTPGTAAAFGGVTKKLQSFGIPLACCADGPSGIRMDCGTTAFSLPNGTALGCTFDVELVGELFRMLGKELRLNRIDSLLGPGMNIHRNPLNGRNFEYISEDPYLTGKIAAAQVEAMGACGIGSTIKHFCGNNQEHGRRTAETVVSERALREIYLKGFEIAVKEGKARSVMTTYGPVNGIWTAGSYDLCTKILRKEWGFDGIVMTDWWAEANYKGKKSSRKAKAPMVLAQNDLYMCVSDSAENPEQDDLEEQLSAGYLTRGLLLRSAKNILGFLLKSPAILWWNGRISREEQEAVESRAKQQKAVTDVVYYTADKEKQEIVIDGSVLHPRARETDIFGICVDKQGVYSITLVLQTDLGSLAQLPISVFYDNVFRMTISIQGTEGRIVEQKRELGGVFGSNHYIKLYYGADGLKVKKVILKLEKAEEEK